MTITQVLYALEVARCRNFSRAADNLFVSQPALSLQIKNLETELGYNLFSRTPKGIFLTELGQHFCKDAQVMADSWNDFQRRVCTQTQTGCRRLRVGMGSRVYSNRLFEDVVRFFEAHPDIEVTFLTEAGQDWVSALKEGTLDLAIDRLPPEPLLPDQRGFTAYDLIPERQCILMSKTDPRSSWETMTFQDLQGSTIITGLENSMEDRTLKQECRDFGVTLNRIYRSDGIETNMNLVRGGKGYVIGPWSFAEYYGVAAVPLEPEINVWLKFICLQKNAGRPEISALRRHLAKVCQERLKTRKPRPGGA